MREEKNHQEHGTDQKKAERSRGRKSSSGRSGGMRDQAARTGKKVGRALLRPIGPRRGSGGSSQDDPAGQEKTIQGIRDRMMTGLIIVVLILGLGILMYPTISNMWNEHRQRQLMTGYSKSVAMLDNLEETKIISDARAYNRTLIGTKIPDAFADHEEHRDTTYESLLNPNGDGMMGTVEIPSINVDLPIYHYTTKEVLEKGAGHLAGSSLPVGGEGTHTVISAHRGLPAARLFTDLDKVKKDDIFYIHVMTRTLAYQVDQIKVVEPENTKDLAIAQGKDYATLLTCTPYGVNTHRLLVRGHRIPYSNKTYAKEKKKVAAPSGTSVILRILCIILGLVIAAVAAGIVLWRKKLLSSTIRSISDSIRGIAAKGRGRKDSHRSGGTGKNRGRSGRKDRDQEKKS